MTGEALRDLLRALRDPARATEAWRALRKHVHGLTRSSAVRHDEAACEDVAQEVVTRLWRVEPDKLDHPLAYVRKMVTNQASGWRRARREQPHAEAGEAEIAPEGTESLVAGEELRAAVAGVVERALASRSERYRDELARDLDQVIDLATGAISIDALLGAETQRDALYKRHQRARDALGQAIDELAGSGALDATQLADVRRFHLLLYRRQRQGRAALRVEQERSQS